MLCGVNFQNNFSKGHNPLYFETQEGLISFENETYFLLTCTFIQHYNKHFSYLLDSIIPNANTKEWKVNFSFEKCVSNKHFRHMIPLHDLAIYSSLISLVPCDCI